MRPWFPPPPWGEGVRTCAKRRRDGGRDGGTTCPVTCGAPVPLASAGAHHGAAYGRGAELRRGAAAWGCAEQLCGAAQWWGGCVGVQRHGGALGRSVWLYRGAVRRCAGA